MKINGNEIKPGNVIEHKGSLWVAVKTNAVKPGKGGAFNQVEMKNLLDGRKDNERFRASETVEKVRLEQKDFQYLYAEGEMLVFMDTETYEQLELQRDFVGDRSAFLQDGMTERCRCAWLMYHGNSYLLLPGICCPVQPAAAAHNRATDRGFRRSR